MDFINSSTKKRPFVIDSSLWHHAISGATGYSNLIGTHKFIFDDDDNAEQYENRRRYPTRQDYVNDQVNNHGLQQYQARYLWGQIWRDHSNPPPWTLPHYNNYDTGNPNLDYWGNPLAGGNYTEQMIPHDHYTQTWLNANPGHRLDGWIGAPGNVRVRLNPVAGPPAPIIIGGGAGGGGGGGGGLFPPPPHIVPPPPPPVIPGAGVPLGGAGFVPGAGVPGVIGPGAHLGARGAPLVPVVPVVPAPHGGGGAPGAIVAPHGGGGAARGRGGRGGRGRGGRGRGARGRARSVGSPKRR